MFWLVADHLGTPRPVVDLTGSLANIKRHDYLPFGEELVAPLGGRSPAQGYPTGNSDGVRQQFTSEERDPETGLDYFGARYYAGTHGRFTSVDPFIGSARRQTPPAWNRYSYALNNPLAYIDPTGEGWVRGRHNEVFWDPEVSTQGEVTKKLVGVSVQVRFQFGLGKQGAGSDYEGPCSTCGSCIPCQTGKNLIEGCEALWSECDFGARAKSGESRFLLKALDKLK